MLRRQHIGQENRTLLAFFFSNCRMNFPKTGSMSVIGILRQQ